MSIVLLSVLMGPHSQVVLARRLYNYGTQRTVSKKPYFVGTLMQFIVLLSVLMGPHSQVQVGTKLYVCGIQIPGGKNPSSKDIQMGFGVLPSGPMVRPLASASWDKTVRLWNPNTGNQKAVLRGHTDGVYGLAFSPDGGILASGSRDGTLRLWDPGTGQQKAVLQGQTQPRTEAIFSLAFSPDGTTLAGGSGHGPVLLWDTSTWQQKTVLKGHIESVLGLAFSPNGGILASAGWWYGTIFLWGLTPRTIHMVSGNDQVGAANSQLQNPFVVEVLDENGIPTADVSVTFRVTTGGGSLSATNSEN